MMLKVVVFIILFLNEEIKLASVPAESVIAVFEPDKVASVKSYMKFKGMVPNMTKISACFRLKIDQKREGIPIISYATESNNAEFRIYVYNDGLFEITCCNSDKAAISINFDLNFRTWFSICASFDFKDGEYSFVINGNIITNKKKMPAEVFNVTGGGILYLGQDQDSYGGGFNQLQSIRGELADMILLPISLTEASMIDFTSCTVAFFNNINSVVSFQNISHDFEISNINIYKIKNSKDLRFREMTATLILPEPRNKKEAQMDCEAIGGSLVIPKNVNDNQNLFLLATNFQNVCNFGASANLWLGIQYDENKNNLVNYKSKEIVTFSNLQGNERASMKEKCVAFYGMSENPDWHGKWEATSCKLLKCSPCYFEKMDFLKLRGLCENSVFDRVYYAIQENLRVTFLGNMYSVINYIPPQLNSVNNYGYWEITRYDVPAARAVMVKKSEHHWPTGKHSWNIVNDECGSGSSELVLTSCQKGEFTCNDGACIPLIDRCDLNTDCPDQSDENDQCSTLILPEKYLATISPPRETDETPLNINISIIILAVRSFELDNFKIVTEVVVTSSWYDRRIKFRNLKETTSLNSIVPNVKQPWIPEYEILAGDNTTCDVTQRGTSVLVKRQSNHVPDNDQNLQEDIIFEGKHNPLIMESKMTIATSCQFDLAAFPFDKQTCKIVLQLSDATMYYAMFALHEESIQFWGERKLLEYYVSSVKNETRLNGIFSVVTVEVLFTNLYMYYVTNTFIPTLIMLVIGGTPFYFPIEDFNDRIMVSLTSLLVEATFFSQVSSSIPKTAYLKFIDLWFVFCIVDLFLVNVMLSVINYLYFCNEIFTEIKFLKPPKKLSPRLSKQILQFRFPGKVLWSRKEWALKLDRSSQIICPAVLLLFVIIYFVYAVYYVRY